VAKVLNAMQSQDIHQLNQLGRVKGIGIKTLEKIFKFSTLNPEIKPASIPPVFPVFAVVQAAEPPTDKAVAELACSVAILFVTL
jgi:hypothetical protein